MAKNERISNKQIAQWINDQAQIMETINQLQNQQALAMEKLIKRVARLEHLLRIGV